MKLHFVFLLLLLILSGNNLGVSGFGVTEATEVISVVRVYVLSNYIFFVMKWWDNK